MGFSNQSTNGVEISKLFKIEDFFDKESIDGIINIYRYAFNINIFLFEDSYNLYSSSTSSNMLFKDLILDNNNHFSCIKKHVDEISKDEKYFITNIEGFVIAVLPVVVNGHTIGTFVINDNSKGFLTEERIKLLCEKKGVHHNKYIDELDSLKDYEEEKFESIIVLYREYFKVTKNFKKLEQMLNIQRLISKVVKLSISNTGLKETLSLSCKSCLKIFHVDNVTMVLFNVDTSKKFEFAEESTGDKLILSNLINEIVKNQDIGIKDIATEITTNLKQSQGSFKFFKIAIKDEIIGYIFLSKYDKDINMDNVETSMLNSILEVIALNYKYKLINTTSAKTSKFAYTAFDDLNIGVYVADIVNKELLYANEAFLSQHKLEHHGNNKSLKLNNDLLSGMKLLSKEGEFYSEGSGKWLYNNVVNTNWLDGREVVLGVDIDITESRKKDIVIEKLRWNNELTDLPNRAKLLKDLETMAKQENTSYYMAVLNVDFFARMNFAYGYKYGDKFILEVTNFLKDVSKNYNIYHLGGTEFVIIVKATEEFSEYINNVRNRFKKPWKVDYVEQYYTASIGVIKIPEDGNTPEAIIRNAVTALKEAKRKGRNRIHYFEHISDEDVVRSTQLEYFLRSTVMKNIECFKIYYQPIVDTQTGKIVSFEALVRWIDPQMGFIFPDEFIGLAEDLGFISIIDNYVLKTASRFIKSLHDKGYKVGLSVNLSPNQLYEDNLVSTIKDTIGASGFDYNYINIEITESSAITNVAETIKKLEELKGLGIRVSLDDFGTGYSSLTVLKDMPVNTVKIDRHFIKDMKKSKYNYTFVKAIIELAHSANLKVCCEGVETSEDWQELKKLKSDVLQGYYFSRPLPQDEVLEKLMSWKFDQP